MAGFDRFLRFSLAQSHEGWVGIDNASLATGQHLVTMICVADMGGLSWGSAIRGIPHFKKLSKVMDDNFPEKLDVVRRPAGDAPHAPVVLRALGHTSPLSATRDLIAMLSLSGIRGQCAANL